MIVTLTIVTGIDHGKKLLEKSKYVNEDNSRKHLYKIDSADLNLIEATEDRAEPCHATREATRALFLMHLFLHFNNKQIIF